MVCHTEAMPVIRRSTLAVALVVSAFAACQPAWASQPPACLAHDFAQKYPTLLSQTLRMAQAESAPYSFRNLAEPEQLSGVDADLARAVFDCIGVNIEVVTGAWSALLADVVSGHSDLLWSGVYYTEGRAKQVDYVTYMAVGTGAMVFKGNPRHVGAMADLCGLRATAGMDSIELALLKDQSAACRHQGKPAVEIVAHVTSTAGEHLLETQRVDVLLTDLLACSRIGATPDVQLSLAFSARASLPIGVAVRKGDADLENALQDALGLLQADGTQQRVLAKYGLDPKLQLTPRVIRD